MRPRLGKVRLVGLVQLWSSFHSYHFASFMNIFILEFTEPIWSLYGLDVSEITTSKESFKSRAIFLFSASEWDDAAQTRPSLKF